MDSNSNHINFRKLWSVRNTERKKIYRLDQLQNYIQNSDIQILHYILIQVGVNDLDRNNAPEVFNDLRNNIQFIKHKYPDIKIILCEITPRNDSRDGEVLECNRLIHDFVECDDNIFLANHSNLRENNYAMLHDVKHVSKRKMGTYVVNIKRALYAAHGKEYIGRRDANNIMQNSNVYNNRSITGTTMSVIPRLWNIANQDAPTPNNQPI